MSKGKMFKSCVIVSLVSWACVFFVEAVVISNEIRQQEALFQERLYEVRQKYVTGAMWSPPNSVIKPTDIMMDFLMEVLVTVGMCVGSIPIYVIRFFTIPFRHTCSCLIV